MSWKHSLSVLLTGVWRSLEHAAALLLERRCFYDINVASKQILEFLIPVLRYRTASSPGRNSAKKS